MGFRSCQLSSFRGPSTILSCSPDRFVNVQGRYHYHTFFTSIKISTLRRSTRFPLALPGIIFPSGEDFP